jgi:magnesium chelatase family protein
MTLARTLAMTLAGIHGEPVDVEADLSAGLPGVTFTGLADVAVKESRDRIRAAICNSGLEWPNRKITVALLPADVRKVGSRFDLAMAVAVLGCAGTVPVEAIVGVVWIGELGLDGRLRPVHGVLPSVIAARAAGVQRVVVPLGNAAEAALVSDIDVRAAGHLGEVVAWLRGTGPAPGPAEPGSAGPLDEQALDLADIAGQHSAKRALAVAAAGSHHLSLVGAPGSGKTMLAERLPGLLPPLDDPAALEVSAVHSVAGLLGVPAQLVRQPPWQAPHHTASVAALVGGGTHLARPGAISLAHRGVLFLDEAAEFARAALDALRQPLESGVVVLHRSGGPVRYPSRFQLVLAANPCPCGSRAARCSCAPGARRRYLQRLSGPLLDRVDMRIYVDPVPHAELFAESGGERSAVVHGRVMRARAAAGERWAGTGYALNGDVPGALLRGARWRLPRAAMRLAEESMRRGLLSARGLDRVLRVAWSVADLGGHSVPDADDVAEALYYRCAEAGSWAA